MKSVITKARLALFDVYEKCVFTLYFNVSCDIMSAHLSFVDHGSTASSKKERSSHQRCSIRKRIYRNFEKFTGIQLCQSPFFNKVAGLRSVILLKKRLWKKCFPVEFCEVSKNTFFTEHPWATVSGSAILASGLSAT